MTQHVRMFIRLLEVCNLLVALHQNDQRKLRLVAPPLAVCTSRCNKDFNCQPRHPNDTKLWCSSARRSRDVFVFTSVVLNHSLSMSICRENIPALVIRDTETTNQLTLSNLESCKGGSRGVENANTENHPSSHVLLTGFFFFTG